MNQLNNTSVKTGLETEIWVCCFLFMNSYKTKNTDMSLIFSFSASRKGDRERERTGACLCYLWLPGDDDLK